MKQITILGATGSVGLQTLEVIAAEKTHQIFALSAHSNVTALARLCVLHQPQFAVMVQEDAARQLKDLLAKEHSQTIVLSGQDALIEIATHETVDTVMAAIVGASGLAPTLAAVKSGKCVLLANKEALVMTGNLFMDAVKTHQATLLPVDSEHNAIFQCMGKGVKQIWLTASGGPFLHKKISELAHITPNEACAHPNWAMGRKISVDSATMMNKALEIIEAHFLFEMPSEKIQVVIHPQSVVHSMVEYWDGSILAQMGYPDMRTPIAHVLAYPNRIPSGAPLLELFAKGGRLDFIPPDEKRFPALRLAKEVLLTGGTASTIFNAANEVAVAGFLQHELPFLDIYRVIEETLQSISIERADTLEVILEADEKARQYAQQSMKNISPNKVQDKTT